MLVHKLCHCGQGQTPHKFRHNFEETIYVYEENGKWFLDVSKVPDKKGKKCKVTECKAVKEQHVFMNHPFDPIEYSYKDIKIKLPENTICKGHEWSEEKEKIPCNVLISEHHNVQTHPFQIWIEIKNRMPDDKLKIVYNEYDEKVKIKNTAEASDSGNSTKMVVNYNPVSDSGDH